MKRILLAVFSGLIFLSCQEGCFRGKPLSPFDGPGPVKILIAGQSNAVSPKNFLHPPKGSSFTLVDKSSGPLSYGITWFYLGDLIHQKTGLNVEFSVIAKGGRTSEWLWKSFHSEWERALKSENFDLIFWVQGENDWGEGLTYAQSYAAYDQIFRLFNEFLPSDRIFLVLNSASTAGPPYVRHVQSAMVSEKRAVLAFDLDRFRVDYPQYFEPSNSEFDGEGLKIHAEKWLEVLERQFRF